MHSINKISCHQDLNKNLGSFIRRNRLNANLSGSELGKLMNISQQQVSRHENGICNLTISQLNQYLIVLDVSWENCIEDVIHNNWEKIFNDEFTNIMKK